MGWKDLFRGRSEVDRRLDALEAAIRNAKGRPFVAAEYEQKRELAFRVAELGQAAVGPLCAALQSPDDDLRQYAALALTRVPDVEARVKALVAAASRVPLGPVEATTDAVVACGRPALEPLLRALRSDDRNVRGRVGDAIARLGPEVVDPLIEALGTAGPGARAEIASALARIGDRKATPRLTELLDDVDEDVRRQAAWSAGELEDPALEPALLGVFQGDGNGFRTRKAALRSLLAMAWTPKTREQEILRAVLELDPVGGRLHESSSIAEDAIASVIGYGADAIPALFLALESGGRFVQENAAKALGEIGDERARGPLQARCDEPEVWFEVRDAAKFALEKLGANAQIQLTMSVRRARTEAPGEPGPADRYGKCSKCGTIVALSDARTVLWHWDEVDAWGYFCPACFIEEDIYTGRLLDRFGDDLIDQYV